MADTIVAPSDSSSLLALVLSHENSTEPTFFDILSRTSPEVLCCLPEPGGEDILNATLNPGSHGIGYFYIIFTRLRLRRYPLAATMMGYIQNFCLRVRPACLVKLNIDLPPFMNAVATFGSQANLLPAGMEAMSNLIKNHSPPEVLTCLHPEFMKIALTTRHIQRAVELSDIDILRIDQLAPVQYQNHLSYHYFAGTVQALHQNYKRAIHLLTIAVSAPGPSTSQIQIDAYKKLILISLLHTSKGPVLPRYVNSSFRSTFKSHQNGKIYNDFMSLYTQAECGSQAYTRLITLVQNNLAEFEKDRNFGLVRLCIGALPRKTVLKCIPLYSALPLAHLTAVLRFGNDAMTNELLESMIAGGELFATIDVYNQVVTFHERAEFPLELGPQLERLTGRAKALEREMRMIESRLEMEPEFLKKVYKELKESEKNEGGVAGDKRAILARHHQLLHEAEEDLGIGLTPSWEVSNTFT